MSQQAFNGVLALVGGAVAAVVLFVPFAAVRYRRAGRFGVEDLAVLLLGGAYALALWTYTLLPLPDPADVACVDGQTRPFATVDDITVVSDGSLLAALQSSPFLQVVMNVALFIPLGFFLRRRGGWGVVATTLVAAGLSLLIELTQLTGVWGLYECAYRIFDVDDLITNTVGAVVGWLLARVLLGGRPREAVDVDRIGRGRRTVGVVCDALIFVIVGAAAAVAFRAWELYGRDVAVDQIDLDLQAVVQWGMPLLLEAVWILGQGRTIGEWVVEVRPVDSRGRSPLWTRVVKLVLGAGLVAVLAASTEPITTWALVVLVTLHLVAALVVPERGLTGLVTRTRLQSTASPVDGWVTEPGASR